jgi:hypothetical protein
MTIMVVVVVMMVMMMMMSSYISRPVSPQTYVADAVVNLVICSILWGRKYGKLPHVRADVLNGVI